MDPSQIVLLVAAIDYAKTIEQAMNTSKGDIKALNKSFDLTKTQLADLIKLTQTPLSKPDRQRVMCMITLDAHNRDITEILVKENVLVPLISSGSPSCALALKRM